MISPVYANPPIVRPGGYVLISAEERTIANVLTTAGTSTTVTINKPDGVEQLAATAMTADATGKHSYNFATTTAMQPGRYTVIITTVDGGVTSIQREVGLFTITNEV